MFKFGTKKLKKRRIKKPWKKNSRVRPYIEIHFVEIDVHGDDDEENDLMNRLDYLKLETIYNDYNIIGGDKGLDLKTFISVMTQENHLGVKKESP